MKKLYLSLLAILSAAFASAQSTAWMPADSALNITKPFSGPGDSTWNVGMMPLIHNGTAYGAGSTLTGGGTNILMDHAYYYTFNLNVPTTATITGVEVIVSRFGVHCPGSTQDTIYLGYNGASIGTYHTSAMTNAYSTDTLGSPTDLWGATLTPALVNSYMFAIFFDTRVVGACSTIALQDLRVKVHYQTSTGISEVATTKALSVYPNPASSEITLASPASNYTITDNLGRTVLSGTKPNYYTQLNISTFAPGLYFLRSGNEVVKFIKQ
jgi:hypothetical protein